MGVISSMNFVKADGIDGFEQIIEESRFLYGFLCYKRSLAHYTLPDKITYNIHNRSVLHDGTKKIYLVTINRGEHVGGTISLTFHKTDDSDLQLYFCMGYIDNFMNIRKFNDGALRKYAESLEAFSSLLILRCQSALEEGMPIGSMLNDSINTPAFYYMSKDLYGIENLGVFLKQFMDYGLPFPDYILKMAIDSGDLEYAAALVHEKDALQMSGKEEVLRL